MRFLVTGASGFVGKKLCEDLIKGGHQVIGATRTRIDLEGVQSHSIRSWQDKCEWQDILKNVDVVFHLAGRVHVMNETSLDPLTDFRAANLTNTVKLAEAVLESSVKKFIFLSSIHVNGVKTNGIAFNETNVPHPQDPYAISKYEAERRLEELFTNSPVELVTVRSPLVYGPGCGGNFLRLMHLVQRLPALPFGSFNNKRSMIFIGNLVDFLVQVAQFQNKKKSLYLICDGRSLSLAEVLSLLVKVGAKSAKVLRIPKVFIRLGMSLIGRAGEFRKLESELLIDSSMAFQDFQWKPKYNIEDGIRETMDWYLKVFSK
jgi:nucleoside-diphosphate-sugar epimerase